MSTSQTEHLDAGSVPARDDATGRQPQAPARKPPRRERKSRSGTAIRAAILFLLISILFVGMWQMATSAEGGSGLAPTPGETWQRLLDVLADPFYVAGPNSVGIFWHLLASLQRVVIGFGLAAVVAIPLGFILGTSTALRWAVDPFVQILRPVSPLAWLPLGLALLSDAEATALFVIFMSALWPILLNTIDGVRGVNPLYLDLARTVEAGRITVVRRILLPAALPSMITGLRMSLSTAWLVIIAAEMLVGGRGMGYFVWNEWNKLNIPSILVAILLIGVVGLVLDRAVTALQKVVPNA
ncbi:ABC transporter permease [Rhodococcus sp. HNM0569]|uniref:ABC transporter permease n=1 Tax=Rhodococcus sp. HNM0569 TaxID=2716340 RepID=UPI00146BBEC1|nr:ABC transporter permease [Rhodococcus sp. HNM0569]NLU82516.1 ABC transporter permease [Rhodococcus sp. HNM0569]